MPSAVCGDDECDAGETCACDDCKSQDRCNTVVVKTCDDDNQCTKDVFNGLTKQCEHKIIELCCGNGKCEESERCDINTYQTKCPADCPLECPAKVSISKFSCGSVVGCREKYENYLVIKGDAVVKATLTNVGERSTWNIYSEFKCDGGNLGMISGDNGQIKGIKFRDYFVGGDEFISVSSRISKAGNSVLYNVKFEGANKEPVELHCSARLQDGDTVDITVPVTLFFE